VLGMLISALFLALWDFLLVWTSLFILHRPDVTVYDLLLYVDDMIVPRSTTTAIPRLASV
jgi:hypothetical protein